MPPANSLPDGNPTPSAQRTRIPAILVAGGITLAAGTALTACDTTGPTPPDDDPIEATFTFEANMEGWRAVAIDTLNPPIDWHVRHTTDEAVVGEGSVELQLDNLNDQGKVWMERAFELEPDQEYDVMVEYAFGTSDWGDVNLFTIIAGVHTDPPRSAEDLTFQGETGHGEDSDVGLVWLDKSYDFSVTAPADGDVHVTIGVWGTWETLRTYYVDDVSVQFVPRS